MWYTVSKSTAFINLQIYRNLWLLRSINGMAVLNFKTISCSDKPTNNKPPDSAAVFSAAELYSIFQVIAYISAAARYQPSIKQQTVKVLPGEYIVGFSFS